MPARAAITSLVQLAEAVARLTPPPPPPPPPPDEFSWLARFERWGAEGLASRELDYPVALATYRDALQLAQRSTSPPFDPPPEFLPRDRHRMECWRSPKRFPELWASWEWLYEMGRRAREGVAPVTEAEFAELAAWMLANEPRLLLNERAASGGMIPVGNGRRVCCWQVRYGVRKGPRAEGSGRTAELVRQLRVRYPAEGEGRP